MRSNTSIVFYVIIAFHKRELSVKERGNAKLLSKDLTCSNITNWKRASYF